MPSRERQTLARRSLLAGLAAVPAIAVVAQAKAAPIAIAAPLTVSPDPDGLGGLWRPYLLAMGVNNAAAEAQEAAKARLPWWAKCGPSHIDHLGNHVGSDTGRPAIQDMQPAGCPGATRLMRPSKAEIQAEFGPNAAHLGEKRAREILAKRLADLEERCAAQQAERTRVGLDKIDARYDATCDAMFDRRDAIMALPRRTAAVAAAQIIATLVSDCGVKATANGNIEMDVAAMALEALLPQLTGELAIDAAEFVNNRDRRIDAMRASRGIA